LTKNSNDFYFPANPSDLVLTLKNRTDEVEFICAANGSGTVKPKLVSISPTVYEQTFCLKVFFEVFLLLKFCFNIFFLKE